ncbi:MAG: hypothetical protein HYR60_30335 [Acidobacteria bacterium]|nr:hypothetical protein [Acidobacteriota bacterium]
MSKKWYNYFVSVDPGLGEPDSGDAGSQSESARAAQTIADIVKSVDVAPTFHQPVADPTSFEQIYQAAEIRPPDQGFTIFKIADMLKSEHIRALPVEIKRSSVLLALDAAGVKLKDVIEDAVRRDRALDGFETVQQRALEQLEACKADENHKLQEEADRILNELRGRIQANNDEVAKERERLHTWRLQKQQEEQRIADAVAPFVSENPITTGPAAAPRAPDQKPG